MDSRPLAYDVGQHPLPNSAPKHGQAFLLPSPRCWFLQSEHPKFHLLSQRGKKRGAGCVQQATSHESCWSSGVRRHCAEAGRRSQHLPFLLFLQITRLLILSHVMYPPLTRDICGVSAPSLPRRSWGVMATLRPRALRPPNDQPSCFLSSHIIFCRASWLRV